MLLASAEQWGKRKSDLDVLFEMLLSLVRDRRCHGQAGRRRRLMHADIREGLASPGSRGAICHSLGSIRDRPLDSGSHQRTMPIHSSPSR